MEYYIEIIILLAPGFIAKEVARALGNVKSKITPIDQVLNYFVYSLFASMWLLLGFVIVRYYIQDSIILGIIMIIVAIVSGIFTGAIWQLVIKGIWHRAMRFITISKDGYEYFQEDTLLNGNLMDGKPHIIEIVRNGNRIARGEFMGASFGSDSLIELKVKSHPHYDGWLDGQYKDYFPYISTYVDVTNGIEIIEYGYPEGFFSGNFDVNKFISSVELEQKFEGAVE
ncbi:hypothetical protein [Veillonella ratti]|uniref:hypothetical protein n=1 Tax=Veillonella ratti TaxID=103892 RepID=UPI000F8CCA5E|nr:hypothetical protein [Veillonella ratti]